MTIPLLTVLLPVEPRASSVGSGTPAATGDAFTDALAVAMGGPGLLPGGEGMPGAAPAALPDESLHGDAVAASRVLAGVLLGVDDLRDAAAVAVPDESLHGDAVAASRIRAGVLPGGEDLRDAATVAVPDAPLHGDAVAASRIPPALLAAALAPLSSGAPTSTVGSAVPVTTSGKSTGLDPAFRERLERVVNRLTTEFGYRVEVVETVRSQDRQDALFAQGRERPGAIVTWTRNSRHTAGMAADLKINGGYTDVVAFDRLAQVASEEGLHTLGARDRGHVELRRAPAQPVTLASTLPELEAPRHQGNVMPTQPSATVSMSGVAQVAQVAQVARVAQLAQSEPIARVATVARVAELASVAPKSKARTTSNATQLLSGGPEASTPLVVASVTLPGEAAPVAEAPPRVAPAGPGLAPDAAPSDGDQPREQRERVPAPSLIESRELPGASPLPAPPGRELATPQRAGGIDHAAATWAADRVSQVVELREAAAERPLTSVLLRLDQPQGGEDRIRIDLRGNSVGAAFDMSDRGMAEDLGRHMAELSNSLQRQGLDAENVTVRTASGRDGLWQGVVGERDATRAAATAPGNGSTASRDHRGSPSRQDHPHGETPRQRQRRGSRGDLDA